MLLKLHFIREMVQRGRVAKLHDALWRHLDNHWRSASRIADGIRTGLEGEVLLVKADDLAPRKQCNNEMMADILSDHDIVADLRDQEVLLQEPKPLARRPTGLAEHFQLGTWSIFDPRISQ
jgi:hypothetical protein